ncbi:MAG: hypothetical protein J7L39_03105 [Candidatus Aenigmarchaeota archaeon]|nr:hypothetical protein [Candidatus Aenigmarchaeota archaeon]
MVVIETKSTSQEIYDIIKEIWEITKRPIPLYLVYNWIRFKKRLNLTTNQIKGALKWLFDSGKLKWVREGHFLIPSDVEVDTNDDRER